MSALEVGPEVVVYAVRHCLGRSSYVARDGAALAASHGAQLPVAMRDALARDIDGHLRRVTRTGEPQELTELWRLALAVLRHPAGRAGPDEVPARPWTTGGTT